MSKNIHFRRIPDYIEQELRNIQEQHVIVAAIINIKKSKCDFLVLSGDKWREKKFLLSDKSA